jgi:hypothetical protein
VFGWMLLDRSDPWRTRWLTASTVVALVLIAFAPSQTGRLHDLQDKIAEQDEIQADLHDLTESGGFDPACEPISAPNTRPVPMLALWLDRRPSEILSAADPSTGYFVEPSSNEVETNFRLDPNDPGQRRGGVPSGFTQVERNGSWELYSSC